MCYFFFFDHYNNMDMFNKMIIIFFAFSFIGWIWEMLLYAFKKDKIINRGFLHGPILPIYGFGVLLIWIIFRSLEASLFIRFLLISVVCSLIEYFTSYILEKLFHKSWWDYNDCKYNLNGRICLKGILFFSVGAILSIDYAIPFIIKIFSYIDVYIKYLNTLLIILLIADICYSLKKPNTGRNISKKVK